MIVSFSRRNTAILFLLAVPLLSAETLETLLTPVVAAEIRRAAAQPPAESPTREDLIQAADLSSGPANPEVIAFSEALVEAKPADAELRRARAEVFLQMAQSTRALQELAAVPAADANSPEILRVRARTLRFLGRLPEAAEAARAGASGDGYYAEQNAELLKELTAALLAWEKTAGASATERAQVALDCGALDVAHDLARAALEKNLGDAAARGVLLKIYSTLEPDTPALTVAINRLRAPFAAAYARQHPTEEDVWRTAIYYASSAITAEGPNDVAFFRNLLRDAAAAGQPFPGEELRLKVISTDDPVALAKIADDDFGPLSENPDIQALLDARRLHLSPAQAALAAAKAQPTDRARWETALGVARAEIEAARLPGAAYRVFVEQATAAGHAFPAEQARVRLYAADTDSDLIDAVREALPATRYHPDLEATISQLLARRITAIPPDSLAFTSTLQTDAKPVFDELTYLPAMSQKAIRELHAGLERVRMWIKLGAPAAALAELEESPVELKSSASGWLLRAQLYRELGRYPEGLLALDRARFLSGKSGPLPNTEQLDGVALASLRVDLLASAQGAARHVDELAAQTKSSPEDASLWGRLALAWMADPLYCIPKALKAAARARALDPKQPDALRAEFEALRLQAQRVPNEIAEALTPLLLARLEHLPKDDWLLRLKLIRSAPYKDRVVYARMWLDELAPQVKDVPNGHRLQRLFKLYTLSTHEQIEDWIDDMGGDDVKPGSFDYPEMEYAREIDNQLNERRGWFVREPLNLFQDEEIDPRNAAAEEQLAQLSGTAHHYWELYEQLRLRSVNEAGPALESLEDLEDPAEFRAQLWKSGRYGPPRASSEVNPECVPYYPGLTSSERKLALRLVELMLGSYIRDDHARRAGLAFDLLQRLQIRPRQLAKWRSSVGNATGAGDMNELPELPRAHALISAGNYAEADALLRPLLVRGVENIYLYYYLGSVENSRRNFAESVRLFSIARRWGRYTTDIVKQCDASLAVIRGNQSQRATSIRARIAYIDEFLGYLNRDMQRAADRAAQAAADMEHLANNRPTVTLYNVDRLQYQADMYALSAQNAQSRAEDIVRQADELQAERARLVEELRRL